MTTQSIPATTATTAITAKIYGKNDFNNQPQLVDIITIKDYTAEPITAEQITAGLNELLKQNNTTYDFSYIEKITIYKEVEAEWVL